MSYVALHEEKNTDETITTKFVAIVFDAFAENVSRQQSTRIRTENLQEQYQVFNTASDKRIFVKYLKFIKFQHFYKTIIIKGTTLIESLDDSINGPAS